MKNFKIIRLVVVIALGLFSCDSSHADKPKKKDKKNKTESSSSTSEVKILEQWDMPNILQEVSGIAFIDNNRFACIQDEAGEIFIYNVKEDKIELEIAFGAAGDYEGIALVGKVAYVVRSDGTIFEVNNITTRTAKIQEYKTSLNAQNDVEGVTYDQKGNRLLLAIKGEETENTSFKGIYAFDLDSKKLDKNPVYKIDLNDEVFAVSNAKKLGSRIRPSEIAIHPTSGDIYILEGTNPQLLILDSEGKIKNRLKISGASFSQPEGMAFSPAGDLYIANEGKKGKGNILKVQVNK